ncbi:hypothetical protein [Neisseria sp. Ec49-e6-T10]|uniref:hypothetical protein n=1 Tax=Neisseria sp. Ec49-e6-T10 TaxID=3140744 RepID=UPI003EB8C5A0
MKKHQDQKVEKYHCYVSRFAKLMATLMIALGVYFVIKQASLWSLFPFIAYAILVYAFFQFTGAVIVSMFFGQTNQDIQRNIEYLNTPKAQNNNNYDWDEYNCELFKDDSPAYSHIPSNPYHNMFDED